MKKYLILSLLIFLTSCGTPSHYHSIQTSPSGHKASAITSDGGYGLSKDHPTIEAAVFAAIRNCKVFNPTDVEQDTNSIVEAYANSGRLAARINPKIIRLSDNRVDLVFEIFEGGLVEIERISFVGNRIYSDRKLRGVLETKQAGFLRTFVQRDTFVEDRIEFDKQVLSDFYKSRGYADFRINSVNAEFSQERDGYFITFNLREGQSFKVGEISVVTDLNDVDTQEFAEVGKVKKDQTNFIKKLMENKLLTIRAAENVVRILPPLNVNKNEINIALKIINKVCNEYKK